MTHAVWALALSITFAATVALTSQRARKPPTPTRPSDPVPDRCHLCGWRIVWRPCCGRVYIPAPCPAHERQEKTRP